MYVILFETNMFLGTSVYGSGFLNLKDKDGEVSCYLGSGRDNRGGHLQTFNSNGYLTSYIGSSRYNAGLINLNNELGLKVSTLGSIYDNVNYKGDGVIMLYDENGEFGWSKDGKSK